MKRSKLEADDVGFTEALQASNFQIQDDRMTWWPHEVEMVAELSLVARHHECHHKTRGYQGHHPLYTARGDPLPIFGGWYHLIIAYHIPCFCGVGLRNHQLASSNIINQHWPSIWFCHILSYFVQKCLHTWWFFPAVGGWKMLHPSSDKPMRYHQSSQPKKKDLCQRNGDFSAPTNLENKHWPLMVGRCVEIIQRYCDILRL